MAISHNNSASGNSDTSPLTFALTVNAGSNKILIVGLGLEYSFDPPPAVSSVTYNGVALAPIDTQAFTYAGSYDRCELWYLLNPAEGEHDVVVTMVAGGTINGLNAGAIVINGAKQQAPEANAKNTGTNSPASVNISTLTDNAWIIDVVLNNFSTEDMTAEGTQTERYEEANDCRLNGSTKPVVSAGATSMTWTFSSAVWGIIAASFEEYSAGGEFVYAGDVALGLIPDDPKGILSMVYGGDIPLTCLPSYTSILDMIYSGAVSLALLPNAPIAPLEKSYEGDIPVVVLPGYSSILDRVYSGDIPLMVLPDFPKAILEKSYDGDISLVIFPNSIYELFGFEFVYSGDIPLSILPGYSSILDRIYSGDIGFVLVPSALYSGKKVIYATGHQMSREEKELLLIDAKEPVFIGRKKPIFISKD